MRLRRPLTAAACLGLTAITVATGAAHASAAPVLGTAAHADVAVGVPLQLTADTIPGLSLLSPTGDAPSTQRMQVIVALTNDSTAAAQTYLHDISDPTSPLYRQYLTPAAYGARFGVSADRTNDVIARLTAGGLRIDAVTAGGDAITASGTVAAVDSTFAVTEKHFVSGAYDFIANTQGPTTWSADGVQTVIGLDTLQRYFTPQQMAKLSGTAAKPNATKASAQKPAATGASTDPLPIDATVYDLRALYDQPSTITGAGQGLTVIGEGDPAVPIADLAQFEKEYGLKAVPVTTNCVDKNAAGAGDCGTDVSGNGEWDIDFQASTAMAPDVTGLTLDFSQSLGDTDLDNAFLKWINDPNGSKQASASEGVCEENPLNPVTDTGTPINSNETEGTGEALGDNQEPVLDTHFLQAAIEGRTMFASTGDTGDTCGALIVGPIGAGNGVIYNGAPESVDYPAASAYVTAVGGTEIYPDETSSTSGDCVEGAKTGGSTVGYPACTELGWPYSGGGSSQYIAEGDYAATDGVTKTPCLLSPDGTTGNTGKNCRQTPDVSAQSGGLLDGMDIVGGGSDTEGAGTSLAAPMWQGMWARIQSGADPTTAPNGFGFADETIYKLATNATTYARDFHDVTIGANPLPAGTGYDNVTGWGTPDVANIIADANKQGPQSVTATPALPEAPLALLVPLVGLVAIGGTYAVRRRRTA